MYILTYVTNHILSYLRSLHRVTYRDHASKVVQVGDNAPHSPQLADLADQN